MLKRMKSKKGFTLAELLIVVAIIAVLVAIAVPLFVGALNDAEERVKEANARAVRGVAVAEILLHNDMLNKDGDYYDKTKNCWYATATVDKEGNVSNLTIVKGLKDTSTTFTVTPTIEEGKTWACTKDTNGNYSVAVKITELTRGA